MFCTTTFLHPQLKEILTEMQGNSYKLRKTFGSLLTQSGLDSMNAAKLTGHSDIQTTFQYYNISTRE